MIDILKTFIFCFVYLFFGAMFGAAYVYFSNNKDAEQEASIIWKFVFFWPIVLPVLPAVILLVKIREKHDR